MGPRVRRILRNALDNVQPPATAGQRKTASTQGDNALLLVHFELIHHPKCSNSRNTQANASPEKWPILTRNSLAGLARKLTTPLVALRLKRTSRVLPPESGLAVASCIPRVLVCAQMVKGDSSGSLPRPSF